MARMEQIIEEIEELIENCKAQPFSQSNIIVNKEEIEELLYELKTKTPEEIKRYQKIINNQEAILAAAQEKADAIINQAQLQTTELISEHEIMQRAYASANEVILQATNNAQEILDSATNDANEMRYAAVEYTDSILASIEDLLAHTITTSRRHFEELMNSLQETLDKVASNRAELRPQEEEVIEEEAKEPVIEDTVEAPVEEIISPQVAQELDK